jgi:hypothetical protein
MAGADGGGRSGLLSCGGQEEEREMIRQVPISLN